MVLRERCCHRVDYLDRFVLQNIFKLATLSSVVRRYNIDINFCRICQLEHQSNHLRDSEPRGQASTIHLEQGTGLLVQEEGSRDGLVLQGESWCIIITKFECLDTDGTMF